MHYVSPNSEQLVSNYGNIILKSCLIYHDRNEFCSLNCHLSIVPKSGAEYAYLFETFAKLHKFWGPLPAFTCNWVYVMILRPAEVAILILICVEYAIEPMRNIIGLDNMETSEINLLYKLLAVSVLCKIFKLIRLHSLKRQLNALFSFNFLQ